MNAVPTETRGRCPISWSWVTGACVPCSVGAGNQTSPLQKQFILLMLRHHSSPSFASFYSTTLADRSHVTGELLHFPISNGEFYFFVCLLPTYLSYTEDDFSSPLHVSDMIDLRLCVCSTMYVRVQIHVCVHTYGDQRSVSGVFSTGSPSRLLRQSLSLTASSLIQPGLSTSASLTTTMASLHRPLCALSHCQHLTAKLTLENEVSLLNNNKPLGSHLLSSVMV